MLFKSNRYQNLRLEGLRKCSVTREFFLSLGGSIVWFTIVDPSFF